jgi:tripartite-type tricarboxylate transporter receptor subunit TctC
MICRRQFVIACATLLAGGATLAHAQGFPEKPVHFIVPFAAGSATDQLARALGQGVTEQTKQPVVVENKPGASGFIAAQYVAKAAPDGYTVIIATNTTHAANEHLFKKVPYDAVKDFAPITALGRGGQIMVVGPKVPAQSVADFIALAKKQPGKLTFGSGSSSSRVAGELFQQMAGVQLLHVPYKSNPLAINDLLGGQIDMMITDTATGLPQVKAGKVRALGMSSRKRSPLAPDVPTIDEAGVKGYEMTFWFAAYAPTGTPAPIVNRLHALLVKVTEGATAKNFYQTTGIDPFVTTPAELAKFQAAESQKWGRIIKSAGIDPE